MRQYGEWSVPHKAFAPIETLSWGALPHVTPLPENGRSLYLRLADELRRAIRAGTYPPGSQLPAERELMERYEVSRSTVRLALAALRSELLLSEGEVGRGTFVRERPPVRLPATRFARGQRQPGIGPWQATTRRAGVAGDVELIGVERIPADVELAHRLEIEEGALVVVRRRHLLAEGVVVQLYDGYYPLALVEGSPLAESQTRIGGVANTFATIGITPTTATEEVTARSATSEEARALQLPAGAPVLAVVRTTRDQDGRVVELLRNVATGSAITLVYEDLPLA